VPPTGAYTSWKNAIPSDWHYTHWTGSRTVNWLKSRDESKPFFLWISFADPHQPFAPPRPYCDMYDTAEIPDPVPAEDVSAKPPHYQWAREGKTYGGYNTLENWDGDQFREIVAPSSTTQWDRYSKNWTDKVSGRARTWSSLQITEKG
jgi:hypothetical protein